MNLFCSCEGCPGSSVSYRLATPNELSIAFAKLSDKVFQDVLEAMNISNSVLSSYKTLIEGTG